MEQNWTGTVWYEFRCPSATSENIDCHACCSMFAICISPSPNDEAWNIESWCESTLLSCLLLQLWQSAYDFLDVFLGSLITCKTMHLYKSHYHQAAPLCKIRAKHGQGNQSMLNQNKIQLTSENPQTTCCVCTLTPLC